MGLEKLVCKNCGSHEISYKEGLYVCDKCGTMHLLKKNDDEKSKTVYFSFEISSEDDPDNQSSQKSAQADTVGSKKNEPEDKSHGTSFLLKGFITIMLLSTIYFISTYVSSEARTVTDLELLQKKGHPVMMDTKKEALAYYRDFSSIVTVDNKYGYEKNTLLMVDVYNVRGEGLNNRDRKLKDTIDDIKIYPHLGRQKLSLRLDEAIKIAEGYLPWDIIEEYYRLDKTVKYVSETSEDEDQVYCIEYALKDIYNPRYKKQEHVLLSNFIIMIKLDKNN